METRMSIAFEAFCQRFATEEKCAEALFAAKWPNGFCCPRCKHTKAYPIKSRRLPLYECTLCGFQTSLISGTVMERTRTPLRLWFQAMFLHACPEGVNARQLSHIINVTYKTAWLISHKLRFAMSQAEAEVMLSGLVKVTDAVLNPRIPSADGKWHKKEQALLAGAAEDAKGDITCVKIKRYDKSLLPDRRSSPDVAPFVEAFVESASAAAIARRHDPRASRILGQRVRDICRGAGWWLACTFGGIGPKHLQVYLDQYCYMRNRREEEKGIFQLLLQDSATRPTITYSVLTGTASRGSTRKSQPAADYAIAS